MQIKIYTVDFRLPRWLKRTLIFAGVAAAILVGVSASIRAATPVAVTTYADGETLSAAKLNTNLANLKQGIDDLQTALSGVQGQLTSGTGVKASSIAAGSVRLATRYLSSDPVTVTAGIASGYSPSPNCDGPNEFVVGGGCQADAASQWSDAIATESLPQGGHWACAVKNNNPVASVSLVSWVVCGRIEVQ